MDACGFLPADDCDFLSMIGKFLRWLFGIKSPSEIFTRDDAEPVPSYEIPAERLAILEQKDDE